MEDNQEYEVSRLKKLLDDRILQAEKENMAILQGSTQGSKSQKDFVHPVKRNVKTCPHIKSPPAMIPEWSSINTRDAHSHIHFLKNLESSLLSTSDSRRRNIMQSVKNRYFPCAVPLSPPIRLKRDIPEERIHSTGNTQNDIFEQQISENILSKSAEVFTVIEKYLPSKPACDKKQSTSASPRRKELLEVKNTNQGASFVHKNKTSPNVRNPSSSLSSYKKSNFSSVEDGCINPEPVESFSQTDDENKRGLHLQISLDSCSTKDVISEMLHKIPEFVNKVKDPSSNFTANACNSSVKRDKQDKISQTLASENVNNIYKLRESPVKQNQTMSSSVQADERKDELLINKHELHHLVKEIVLETLRNMQPHEQIPLREKSTFTAHKVDSGIQSEIENDIADFRRNFKMDFPDKDVLLDQGNSVPRRENFNLSKGVQVDLYPVQTAKSLDVHDKSCNTDNPVYLHQIEEEDSMPIAAKQTENGDSVSERNLSSAQDPNKIELMLEKIYEHICQEKEVSRSSNNISPNYPILTRDVAVQFNPLHTSTKSTLTSEIQTADSSCQYDIQYEVTPCRNSTADASVQCVNITEPCYDRLLQINAYTQYEPKTFLDSVAQTELLFNSEHSATNTSISSTPVSDSMFMDDLLSEGEISLPWNLRLLSLPGGGLNTNNADSSDTSIKERDYSLSEGEIHPNVIHYLNMCHSNNSEENDFQQDLYPTKLVADSKIQYTSSSSTEKPAGQSIMCSKNLHFNISNSSLSEGEINSNVSLSSGEVLPGFMVSFLESPLMPENRPSSNSSCNGGNLHYDSLSAASCSQTCDLPRQSVNSSFNESGLHRGCTYEETDFQKLQTALQTVDEEVPSASD